MSKKISREQLLDGIRQAAARLGRVPRVMDCPHRDTIFSVFGSFKAALKEAGFECEVRGVSREEVVGALIQLGQEHGGITYKIAQDHLPYDVSVVERHFGSWSSMMRQVFGKTNTARGVSNEELLERLREVEACHGKATRQLLCKYAEIGTGLISRRFGSFGEACRQAGVKPVSEPGLQTWVFKIIRRLTGCTIVKEKTFPWLRSPRGFHMRVDGYVPELRLCIEFDGRQHREFSGVWHKWDQDYFEYRKQCDLLKEHTIRDKGLYFARFRDDERISDDMVQLRIEESIGRSVILLSA